MAQVTYTAKTDLTYEEIYEGYANGKSRLPKIIKDIENGNVALAETTGVSILRRRTEGGNAQTPGNVGQDSTTVVAKLISAARWDSLIAGYSGSGEFVTPPSYNLQTVNVRAVVKEPFDLIDQVAGINYAQQGSGAAANTETGREAKIQEKGTGVRVREIDFRAPAGATADVDVRDYFANDRIGGGGATGEVHGVDQGISEVLVADSEGRAVGITAGAFPVSLTAGSIGMTFALGATGETEIEVTFDVGSHTAAEIASTINDAVAVAQIRNSDADEFRGVPVDDPVAVVINGTLELHSRKRGLQGEDTDGSGIQIINDNTPLGLTSADDVLRGATVGDVDGTFEQTIIDLASEASACRTTVRYGTAQFGALQVVGTTNGLVAATASAYIVHPDFLEDLIDFQ